MNKLFWTISIFLLLGNGIFANSIFEDYPWLTDLIQQDNCSNEKIEVYQTGIFSYLLVTDVDGVATLYNDSGQFYCQNSSNFDCVALYNLEGPIDSWDCTNNTSNICSVTITNRLCRFIGVYDENDNFLTGMIGGPAPNGPPGRIAPVWEDPRPLGATENRTYVFKENNFVLGRQTVSCDNPQIESVSNYTDGCNDGVGLAQLRNIGCRTITAYNTGSGVVGNYAPDEAFLLSTGPFIHILVAGTDTLAIITDDNTSVLTEIDSGGCETTSNPAIFKDYPWLADLVNPNSCATEKVEVFQLGIFNYLLVTDASGVERMYNAAGQFYCQNASNYDCIAAYNLGVPIDSWSCGVTDCNCTQEIAPVCGVNNVTYNNACEAACAGVEIAFNTACNVDPPAACFFGESTIQQLENQAISCAMTTRVTRIDYNGNSYFRTDVGRTKSSIEQLNQPCPISEYYGNIKDCEGTIICEFALAGPPPNFDPEVCDAIQRGLGTEMVLWEHPELSCSVEDPFSLPVIQNAINQTPITNEAGAVCSFVETITQIDYAGFTYFSIKENFNAVTACTAQPEKLTFYDCEGDFIGGIGNVPFCQSAALCNALAAASGTVIWAFEEEDGVSNPVIFKDYPWLTDLVDPNSCLTEKVEVFQLGIFNYLLVTEASGVERMYNENGQFYCQNANNYDCIAAYNLGAPVDSWTCGSGIIANCANYSGTIFFEKCDDGRDFYFIRTSTGEVLDAYYGEGIDFTKYDGQRVNFDYVTADFLTPCSIASEAVIITCIEENNSLSQSRDRTINEVERVNFTLFPNPTEGQFTFQLRDPQKNSQQLQLVDLLGRTLHQQTIEPFTKSVDLDLSLYQNGIYYVALYSKGKKVVMQKIRRQGVE